jgi:hypothetical protein
MKDHIARIESGLKEVARLAEASGSDHDIQELIKIIHRPGWTTPAEAQLVIALLEATTNQMKQAAHLRQELFRCAKAVGTPTPVGVN